MNAKKYLNVAAAICSIVIAGLLLMAVLVILTEYETNGMVPGGIDQDYQVAAIFVFLFCVSVIIISSMCIAKRNSSAKGFKITLIILMAFLFLVALLGTSIFIAIICAVPAGLEIASLAIPAKSEKYEQADQSILNSPQSVFNYGVAATKVEPEDKNDMSIRGKIEELKKLKDDNLITEEQYTNAVDELITKLK